MALTPPDNLLQDCPGTTRQIRTLADSLQLNLDYKASLEACNAEKAALREWKKEAAKTAAILPKVK